MKVKVLFFGATADAVDEREIEFAFDENLKAEQVFTEILDAFPSLKKSFANSLLFSLNQEYASGDEIVRNGDELAVFTAVSGG
jgi:molybdopterin converting factor small subunit